MWPFLGAIALFVVLGLLLIGERVFERGRRARALPRPRRRLPPR
ncbi:MAG TPA: hypothetical protein VFC31_07335 [Candidatus Limnocylindria bacterium]|nr:hypothetical protein [Candidatus Limnocylindria bacterium]